jgi:hypothetical protein
VLARGRGAIRMLTLAPGVAGAAELLEDLAREGVLASLGHSHAARAEIEQAIAGGGVSRDAPLQHDGAAPPPRAGSGGGRVGGRAADGRPDLRPGPRCIPRWCGSRPGRSASGWC